MIKQMKLSEQFYKLHITISVFFLSFYKILEVSALMYNKKEEGNRKIRIGYLSKFVSLYQILFFVIQKKEREDVKE